MTARPLVEQARAVVEDLGRTQIAALQRGLSAAGELVHLVPLLLERIIDLEAKVAVLTAREPNRQRLACTCIRCGKKFWVFPSQLKLKKFTGKFCSRACFLSSRPGGES